MEFGLFCGGFTPKGLWGLDDSEAEHRRLLSEVDLAVLADETNWKYWWTTEHHFLDEYSHISANEVLLPWVGARTERLHVGSGIFNITPPVNHPARVAERVAMLDHLTNGRFEFGTGRGSSTTEQQGFGITRPRSDQGHVRRSDRRVPQDVGRPGVQPRRHLLLDAHRATCCRSRTSSRTRRCGSPPATPERSRRPPRWASACLCFTVGSPQQLAPLVEIYKNTIADAEPVGDYVNDNVAVVSQFLCLEDRDEARDWMTKSGGGYHNSLLFRYLDTFPRPAHIPPWPEVLPPLDRPQVDHMIEENGSMVGDPADCAAAVERLQAVGCDQVLMGPSSTLWPHEVCAQSVELFGKQVIPEFDTDPEHSTSRYRREAAARAG